MHVMHDMLFGSSDVCDITSPVFLINIFCHYLSSQMARTTVFPDTPIMQTKELPACQLHSASHPGLPPDPSKDARNPAGSPGEGSHTFRAGNRDLSRNPQIWDGNGGNG